MNRHQRRAQASASRHAFKAGVGSEGSWWKQRVDPADPRFVLIEMRIPNGGMPEAEYFGVDARDRIARFCTAYLEGAGLKVPPAAAPVEQLTLKDAAESLHAEALRRATGHLATHGASECTGGLSDGHRPPRIDFSGWSFLLSIDLHDGLQCCHFSAQLQPVGRSSTDEDWDVLGRFMSRIVSLTGYKGTEPPEALTPVETTHPSRVLHWTWHSDGSQVSPAALEMLKATLQRN